MLNACSTKTTLKSEGNLLAAMREYMTGTAKVGEIAARFGVSPATISTRARLLGLPKRRRGRRPHAEPPPRHREIIQLAKDRTYEQIADQFGCSKQRVHQILKRWSGAKTEHLSDAVTKADEENVYKSHVVSFRVGILEHSLLKKAVNTRHFVGSYSVNQVAKALVYHFIEATQGNLESGIVVTT